MRHLIILLSCAFIALAPSLADAAAGNSRSMGSRGSQTYSTPPGARPLERSITPRQQTQPQYAPRPSTPLLGGGFSQHPFMTGLLGGFIGAGIAGMLFGHNAYAAEVSPMGNMLGLLLQIALIGGLIYFGLRLFRRRLDPSAAGIGNTTYYTTEPVGTGTGIAAAGGRAPVAVTDADYVAFGDLLVALQTAWSAADLAQIKRCTTPEMLSYFAEELSRNASQGVENRVENVKLMKGDLLEAWQEDGMEYATAAMRWSAQDYVVRTDRNPHDGDYVVSGLPAQPVDRTEVWTFVRGRGGHWLLSAIQQTN